MIYQGENFSIDTRSYTIRLGGEDLSVEPQVFDLLVYLIENRDRVVTRDELLENLWPGRIVSESALNGRLKTTRKCVGDDGKQQKIIRTIHRRGYRFIAGVDVLAQPASHEKPAAFIQPRPASRPSLAVLRFSNLSDDAAQAYFSEGISMNIASGLGRINRVIVKSALSYDLTQTSAAAAARELEVDYLLSGAVQREGERVRIYAELLAGASGESVWSQRYDRRGRDVIDIQDEIATGIISTLVGYRGKLGELEYGRVASVPTREFDAYDLLLKGIHHKENHSRKDNLEAHRCFEQALTLEPDNTEALGWNAFVHGLDVYMGWSEDPQQSLDAGFSLARRGISIDRLSEISHWALAMCHDIEGNTKKTIEALGRAREINPNNPDLQVHEGEAIALGGDIDRGIALIRKAMQLRPDFPEWYWWHLGIALFAGKRYLECRDAFNHMSEHNDDTRLFLAACNALIGDLDESGRQYGELRRLNPDFEPEHIRRSHGGYPAEVLDQLLRGITLAGSQLSDHIRLVR